MGLPHRCGFGFKASIPQLAKDIEKTLIESGQSYITWQEAVKTHPAIHRLVPSDFRVLVAELKAAELQILHNDEGELAQIGKSR